MRRERYTKMHWEEDHGMFKIPDSCLDSAIDYGLTVLYWVLHTWHKLEMRETMKDLVRNLGPGVEVMYDQTDLGSDPIPVLPFDFG